MLHYEDTEKQSIICMFNFSAWALLKHNLLSLHSNSIPKPSRGRTHLQKTQHTETHKEETEEWINRKKTPFTV